ARRARAAASRAVCHLPSVACSPRRSVSATASSAASLVAEEGSPVASPPASPLVVPASPPARRTTAAARDPSASAAARRAADSSPALPTASGGWPGTTRLPGSATHSAHTAWIPGKRLQGGHQRGRRAAVAHQAPPQAPHPAQQAW
ncbi:hypothetical protein APUTEX25_002156, partial [Auxenochlorella protothecoides]